MYIENVVIKSMFATNPSLMVVYCHVVIFAETMDRDLEKEELLGDIIREGGDIDLNYLSFLNENESEEREDGGSGEEEGVMTAPVIELRTKEIMTAPVIEWRRKP